MSQKSPERTQTNLLLAPQTISEEVLLEKYSKGTERTILEVNQRVARALAAAEAPEQRKSWEAKFLQVLQSGFFVVAFLALHNQLKQIVHGFTNRL